MMPPVEGSSILFVIWTDHHNLDYLHRSNPAPGWCSFLFAPPAPPCHPGVSRTLALLSCHFRWQLMKYEVTEYVAACPECARRKTSTQRPQGLLQPLSVPRRLQSYIALDFIAGLPASKDMMMILSMIPLFSKSAHFGALPKLPSSKETAELLFQHVFRLHDLPLEVTSYHRPQFVSRFLKDFRSLIGAKVQFCGFHPQTNGQTERLNQELGKSLHCMVKKSPTSWSDSLPWVEYAHNYFPVSSMGLSPFASCLGYQPPLFH